MRLVLPLGVSRATPPAGLGEFFQAFDAAVRECLEAACSGPLTAEAWMQASLSTRCGGLGLRSVTMHAAAGFAASVCAIATLCSAIGNGYVPSIEAAVQQVNQQLPPARHFQLPVPVSLRQSQALDQVVAERLAEGGPEREAFRAHFQLLQQPDAALGLSVAPTLFRTMVRLRLRLAVAAEDIACPLCDGTADKFGDHARVCPCGGDRVKRRNELRNLVAARNKAAEANLLLPRPEFSGGTKDGSAGNSSTGRRPAHVWFPHWNLHGPAAFDLAVTSGLRQGHLAASVADGSRAALDYEVRKCQFQNTHQLCASEGLQFLPLVVEACASGWGPTALRTWKLLADALAARSGY